MIRAFNDPGYSFDLFRRHAKAVHGKLRSDAADLAKYFAPASVLRLCATVVVDQNPDADLDDHQHPTSRLAQMMLAYVAALGGMQRAVELPLSIPLLGAVYAVFAVQDFDVAAEDVTPAVLEIAATLKKHCPDLAK